MGKKSGSGSAIILPRAQKPFFWVKILKFFDADTRWKKFRSGIRDKHPVVFYNIKLYYKNPVLATCCNIAGHVCPVLLILCASSQGLHQPLRVLRAAVRH
jgi:hypothetical protein